MKSFNLRTINLKDSAKKDLDNNLKVESARIKALNKSSQNFMKQMKGLTSSNIQLVN